MSSYGRSLPRSRPRKHAVTPRNHRRAAFPRVFRRRDLTPSEFAALKIERSRSMTIW